MRAVVQRVSWASVTVEGEIVSEIKKGLLILVGVEEIDNQHDVDWLAKKIVNLRIFNDDKGVMNKSLQDVSGDVIVVSQFTLHAATKKGNRPSYIKAASPKVAIPVYESFVSQLEFFLRKKVGAGVFGADMKVELLNDGPVTILIDTQRKE